MAVPPLQSWPQSMERIDAPDPLATARAAWDATSGPPHDRIPAWPTKGVAIEGDFSGIQRFVLRPVPGASGATAAGPVIPGSRANQARSEHRGAAVPGCSGAALLLRRGPISSRGQSLPRLAFALETIAMRAG